MEQKGFIEYTVPIMVIAIVIFAIYCGIQIIIIGNNANSFCEKNISNGITHFCPQKDGTAKQFECNDKNCWWIENA